MYNEPKNITYFDYAASTPTDKRVLKIAEKYFINMFGNPSSHHLFGNMAKKGIASARKKVANYFNCKPDEIIFTSGGTEAENLLIKGFAFSNKKNGSHMIVSPIEHNAVSSSFDFLEKHEFEISKLTIDKHGFIDINNLFNLIRDDTILISIMYVNNELGTIEPIKEVGRKLKEVNKKRLKRGLHKVCFHTDAEAAGFYLDCDVNKLGVDLMVINASKMYGMKGAAAAYIRKGIHVSTQITGGGQEKMLRGGTENVPAIVALGEAARLALLERKKNNKKISHLKDMLHSKILKEFPDIKINTPQNSICNILHITYYNKKSSGLAKKLANLGVCVSIGSACSGNHSALPHVPQQIGLSKDEIKSSIRMSLGKQNTKRDIDVLLKSIKKIIQL